MLTHIRLQNFKAFPQLDIRPRRITVLIGPNGTGKSSVFHALMLLRQSIHQQNLVYKQILIDLVGFNEVLFKKAQTRALVVEIGGGPPFREKYSELDEFAYSITADSSGVSANSGLVAWKQERFAVEWRRAGGVSNNRIKRGGGQLELRGSPDIGRPVGSLDISGSNDKEVTELANHLSNLFGVIEETLNSLRLVPAIRGFSRASYQLQAQPIQEIKYQEDLGTQATHLASTLEMGSQKDVRDKVSDWTETVTGVQVTTDTEADQQVTPKAGLPEDGGQINLMNEGFATNQLVFLMFQLATTPSNGTLCIEEPEIHLHPAAQSKLTDLLVRIANDEHKQILITTHSEHILFGFLNNVAEGKLERKDLAIYAFQREGIASSASEVLITGDGLVEGAIPGFFEANMEAQQRHIHALMKRSKLL